MPPVIILACYPTVFDKSAPSCIQVQRPFPQLASQKLRTNGTSYSYSYFYSWGQVFRCSRSYTVIDVHAEYTRQVLFHSKIRPFCIIISIQMFSTVTAEAMWGNAGSGGQQCAIMGTIIDNTPVWWSSDVMRLYTRGKRKITDCSSPHSHLKGYLSKPNMLQKQNFMQLIHLNTHISDQGHSKWMELHIFDNVIITYIFTLAKL